MKYLFLVEMDVTDPDTSVDRVERFANGSGFTTSPTDTPANTYYAPRVKQPAVLKRQLYGRGTTQGATKIELGHLILDNPDGELDYLLDVAVDGRAARVLWGEQGDAYADLEELLVATMEQVDGGDGVLTVRIRDRQTLLDVPLQAVKYAGDNVLPDGLEGTSELAGKPKPACFGVVKNAPAVQVNSSKLIYQVNDGAVVNISAIRDRGIAILDASTWTSRTSGFADGIFGAAYGNGIFVIVGDNHKISSSDDLGVTWTPRSSPLSGTVMWVIFADGYFFIGSNDSGSNRSVGYSTDGSNWTACTGLPSGIGTTADGGAYGGGRLMVAYGGGRLAISDDLGVTWTSLTNPLTATDDRKLLYANNRFILAHATETAVTTDGGTTWRNGTTALATGRTAGVEYGAGVYVLISSSTVTGYNVTTSLDGIAWSQPNVLIPLVGDYCDLTYANGKFWATSSGQIWTSRDGARWSPAGVHTGIDEIQAVAVGDTMAVVVGWNGLLYTSAAPTEYATEADLLDDEQAPAPGAAGVYLAGGLFRLGSTPDGQVTADVEQADVTPSEMYQRLLERAGLTSADWSAADLAALPTPTLGYWTDQEVTIGKVADLLAASLGRGGWWGVDHTGTFRIAELPNLATAVPVASFTADDLLKTLVRIAPNDENRGLPANRTIVRYGRYYAVQTNDVAGGVSPAVRAELAKEWREATIADAAVKTLHPLSTQDVIETLLVTEADAQAAANARQALRGVKRDAFELLVELVPDNATVDFGHVITQSHDRYGLSAGRDFIVMGITPDGAAGTILLTVFG